jgi:hypothetical protein
MLSLLDSEYHKLSDVVCQLLDSVFDETQLLSMTSVKQLDV